MLAATARSPRWSQPKTRSIQRWRLRCTWGASSARRCCQMKSAALRAHGGNSTSATCCAHILRNHLRGASALCRMSLETRDAVVATGYQWSCVLVSVDGIESRYVGHARPCVDPDAQTPQNSSTLPSRHQDRGKSRARALEPFWRLPSGKPWPLTRKAPLPGRKNSGMSSLRSVLLRPVLARQASATLKKSLSGASYLQFEQ